MGYISLSDFILVCFSPMLNVMYNKIVKTRESPILEQQNLHPTESNQPYSVNHKKSKNITEVEVFIHMFSSALVSD